MISPYKKFTMHAPYTYIHLMHLTILWKNLQAYNIQDSVQWKKEHKNITHSLLLRIVSQLNNFRTILSQIFTIYFHRVYVLEYISLLPKGIDNNMIFLFQKCDTFDRTMKGRTWLTSQDHPDFTQLIRSPQSKYIIDSQK